MFLPTINVFTYNKCFDLREMFWPASFCKVQNYISAFIEEKYWPWCAIFREKSLIQVKNFAPGESFDLDKLSKLHIHRAVPSLALLFNIVNAFDLTIPKLQSWHRTEHTYIHTYIHMYVIRGQWIKNWEKWHYWLETKLPICICLLNYKNIVFKDNALKIGQNRQY
jgi:hypothetical protein